MSPGFPNRSNEHAVAIKYDKRIDNSRLSNFIYSVQDRTITTIYANTSAAKTPIGIDGNYMVIEFVTSDKSASTIFQNGRQSIRKRFPV
jgi:predicted peptidase